jgi:hypothetical protein
VEGGYRLAHDILARSREHESKRDTADRTIGTRRDAEYRRLGEKSATGLD